MTDTGGLHTLLPPLAQLRADAGEHIFIQLADRAILFKQRDEARGRDHAAVLLHPADERFRADNLAGFGIALGLIIGLELMADDGRVKAILDLHALKERVLIHILIERDGVVAAASCRAQRQIGQFACAADILFRTHGIHAEARHDMQHAHLIRQAADAALNLTQTLQHNRALTLVQIENEMIRIHAGDRSPSFSAPLMHS